MHAHAHTHRHTHSTRVQIILEESYLIQGSEKKETVGDISYLLNYTEMYVNETI